MLCVSKLFPAKRSLRGYLMSKKYYCVIEVNVPGGPEGWQMAVNDKMRHTLEKLKVAVEELGGRVFVRY
jgi:hypothetical protein